MPTNPEPITDLAAAIPELAELRDAVVARAFDTVAARLTELRDRDDALVAVAARVVVDTPGAPGLIHQQLGSRPDDLIVKALYADSQIAAGWRARSGYRASYVSDQQFETFHDHLRKAERALIEICAMDPTWTYPWHLRLMTARGLELGQSETRRRYDRLAELNPHHLPAQQQFQQQLCPKWSGSWEELFEFSRKASAEADPGSANPLLIAKAHLEKWLDLDKSGDAYLRSKDVIEELDGAAAASVLHPQFRPGFDWVTAHSAFGVAFALAGDRARATPHFRALGPFVDDYIWGILGGSLKTVSKVRAHATSGAAQR